MFRLSLSNKGLWQAKLADNKHISHYLEFMNNQPTNSSKHLGHAKKACVKNWEHTGKEDRPFPIELVSTV